MHTLTAADGSFTTPTIQAGASATFVAPRAAGRYPITCTFHASMSGTLVVTAAAPAPPGGGPVPPGTGPVPPPPGTGPSLPITGAQTALLGGLGALLLVAGAAMYVLGRRRRVAAVTEADSTAG
jgi:LPXTG-motif cell wall-anchored protein